MKPTAMDDDQRFELLSAYLDGELSPADQTQVEDWLATDPTIRQELQQLQQLQTSFNHLPGPLETDVEPLIDQVLLRVQPIPWGSRLRVRSSAGTLVAGLSVTLLSGGLIWRGLNPQPLITLESPPVRITLRPSSVDVAQRYLLSPTVTQDPFTILFRDENRTN